MRDDLIVPAAAAGQRPCGYPPERWLERIVEARTATDKHLVAVGRVVGYCDAPTVTIERADGTRVHWRADLCEVLDITYDTAEVLFPQGTLAGVPPQARKRKSNG